MLTPVINIQVVCNVTDSRGKARTAATSKMECFVIIVNDWKDSQV